MIMKSFDIDLLTLKIDSGVMRCGLSIDFYYKVRKITYVEILGNERYYSYWLKTELY